MISPFKLDVVGKTIANILGKNIDLPAVISLSAALPVAEYKNGFGSSSGNLCTATRNTITLARMGDKQLVSAAMTTNSISDTPPHGERSKKV